MRAQRAMSTIARAADVTGIGLHTGASSLVRLLPAPAEDGIYFVRSDLRSTEERLPAWPINVVETRLCTTLGLAGSPDVTVSTVEHLMAALSGMGIVSCRIEVNAPELPLLDGSAAPWVDAIRSAGIEEGAAPPPRRLLASTVRVSEEDAWVVAVPAKKLRLTYGIDFPHHAPIGRQWFSWAPSSDAPFEEAIAPARTFALHEQISFLREQGLIQGGSLDNALICDHNHWLNGPLRFADEPVRHKLLDLVGDLALLGRLPSAHVVAYRASHRLHVRLALALERRLAEEGERHNAGGS
jgi:UDP-3-O-[3-hydroxymyristoyl] N-acetylglucosamine deacetylase